MQTKDVLGNTDLHKTDVRSSVAGAKQTRIELPSDKCPRGDGRLRLVIGDTGSCETSLGRNGPMSARGERGD